MTKRPAGTVFLPKPGISEWQHFHISCRAIRVTAAMIGTTEEIDDGVAVIISLQSTGFCFRTQLHSSPGCNSTGISSPFSPPFGWLFGIGSTNKGIDEIQYSCCLGCLYGLRSSIKRNKDASRYCSCYKRKKGLFHTALKIRNLLHPKQDLRLPLPSICAKASITHQAIEAFRLTSHFSLLNSYFTNIPGSVPGSDSPEYR